MFKPLHDYVLVKQNEQTEKTSGGIILAQTVQGLESGVVVAVGTGYINQDGSVRPLTVQEGHTVFLSGNPHEIEYGGEKFLLFRERDLIGVEA